MVTVKELVDKMTEKCASSNTFASSRKDFLIALRYACKLNCDTKRCTCREYGLECTSGCGECRGNGLF